MAICSHCHAKKAKRRCPALGADLCPLCCGLLREKELRCPPGCPHLLRHRPYEEGRIIRKTPERGPERPPDERLDWLVINVEAVLERIAAARPEFTDRDAVLWLERARQRIEKARPVLLVTESREWPADEPAEAIYQAVERCRYDGPIVIPQVLQAFKKEEKLAALEQVIRTVKRLNDASLESRDYLDSLVRKFARSRGEPEPGKRIIPVR